MQVPKVSLESLQYRSTSVENSRNTHFLANFTLKMIENEAGPVFKGVDLN